MKTAVTATRSLMVAGLVGLVGLVAAGAACSTNNSSGGTGGKGSGGRTGTGGTSPGTGGTSPGTGGRGTGGSAPGTGGTAPTDGGTDGGTQASFAYTFDTDVQGFVLNNFVPTDGTINLAAPDASAPPTLAHDPTVGNPNPGSLKVTATYSDYKQSIDVIIGPFPPLNLTGKTIHAKVMLASGTLPAGSGALLHASSTSMYRYGSGAYTALSPGVWTDLTMDVGGVTTANWDASQIFQVGILVRTGDPPDGGTFAGPVDVVFNIDTITDGTGAVTSQVPFSYTFDTGNPGFSYNTFVPTLPQVNLAAPDGGTPPTLMFDNTEGNPAPGSLRAAMTFSGYQQFAEIVFGPRPPVNLMGKTLHAKVRLTQGTFGTGAGATLRAYTTSSYVFGQGPYTALTLGTWTDMTMDLSAITAAMWNPSMVVQIGLQFYSGDPPEAGAFAGPNDVVFHIDTITD